MACFASASAFATSELMDFNFSSASCDVVDLDIHTVYYIHIIYMYMYSMIHYDSIR